MTNKNKSKGNNGERECASIFTSFFGGSWCRTATSGAITGKSNAWRAKLLSESQLLCATNDITPPDEYRLAALEVKFYKDFEFHHLFRKEGNNTLNEWITQVYDSGIDMVKSFPMICFKINRKGWFTCVWKSKIEDLDYKKLQHTVYHYKDNEYVIFELDTFLKTFTEELKKKFS